MTVANNSFRVIVTSDNFQFPYNNRLKLPLNTHDINFLQTSLWWVWWKHVQKSSDSKNGMSSLLDFHIEKKKKKKTYWKGGNFLWRKYLSTKENPSG